MRNSGGGGGGRSLFVRNSGVEGGDVGHYL